MRDHAAPFYFPHGAIMADMTVQASKPAEVKTDSGQVKAVSIPDQIAADQYEATKTAKSTSKSVWAGCRISKAQPPGTIGKDSET